MVSVEATLRNGDPTVREVVVRALGGQVERLESAVLALVGMLKDETPGVRGAAIHALERKGKLPEYAVQALIGALSDVDPEVQEKAILVLGGVSPESSAAAEALLGLLAQENQATREITVQALTNDVELSEDTTKALINNLTDARWYVREVSVRILSGHDEWSVTVVEALVGTVLDKNASVREAVVRALASELPEESIQTLLEELQNEDWETKEAALRVLGAQDSSTSGAAIDALIISLREKNSEATKSDESSNRPSSDDLTLPTTRIEPEHASNDEIRYVIVGNFSGNAIRVWTECTSTGKLLMTPTSEQTGELRHVITECTKSGTIRYIVGDVISSNAVTRDTTGPRIASERELRHVNEERTETGEIRNIGDIITENKSTSTRTASTIVAEMQGDVTYHYLVTNEPNDQEVRTLIEPTEDGSFRIIGGPVTTGLGTTLIGNSDTTNLQKFRLSQSAGSSPSQETVSIRTQYDNASNEHFVLFEDIRTSFKHAVHVMKGTEIVPFEVDEQFLSIEPQRIKYYPEVILDVVVDNPGKDIAEDTGK
ncbi:hypothetical protein BGZ65_008458, partial [Modicella reniformis]